MFITKLGGGIIKNKKEEKTLLTKQQEIELSKRIIEMNTAKEAAKDLTETLDEDDKQELNKIISIGEDAIETFVEMNLGLVYNIMKDYHSKLLVTEDLVQLGCMGLFDAATKYDYRKGTRFSTYAYNWINHYITRGIKNFDKHIRIPVNQLDKQSKVMKEISDYITLKGEEPSLDYLSKKTKISKKDIKDLKLLPKVSSLDEDLKNKEGLTLMDFIGDEDNVSQEDKFNNKILNKKLKEHLKKTLSENEQELIIFLYGLNDGVNKSFEDAANHFNKNISAIRQMRRRALDKLRVKHILKSLNKFV